MAAGRKKKPSAHKPAPDAATKTAAPAQAPTRDVRPYIYLALDELFAIAYIYLLAFAIPNRHLSAELHLWALPVLMQLMAFGMATVLLPPRPWRRIGWWVVVASASLLLLLTILLIVRVLVSAAFLSGVYGSLGKAAALSALVGVALVIEVVALVPLLQLKYVRTRAGRRAFAIA